MTHGLERFDAASVDMSVFGGGGEVGVGKVPVSAYIQTVLRSVAPTPDVVLDESTIELLCEGLRRSARSISDSDLFPEGSVDRPEAFRYVLTVLAYAIDRAVSQADPTEPLFSRPYQAHLVDWGAANPDGVYRVVSVRDDLSYRISGTLGNASYQSFDLRLSETDAITPDDLEPDSDGNFEIYLGGPRREGRWWPLVPGTAAIVSREFFDDWMNARRSILRIECLDGEPAPRAEHSSRRVAADFLVVGEWIAQAGVDYWIEQSRELLATSQNVFLPIRRDTLKLPPVRLAAWQLEPEEALVIEIPKLDAEYWGLQLASSLWHTLDFANRSTSYNRAQVHQDSDGVYRFVLAHEDPGVFNWLDTMGLERGIVIVRMFGAASPIEPSTRVVKVSEVADLLEGSRCSEADRQHQRADRREGLARLISD